MFRSRYFFFPGLLAMMAVLGLQGCGCGFDCSGSPKNSPATLNLGFSDAPVDDAREVVLEVSAITLRRAAADDVVVETFTIPSLGVTDAESFQVDLLDYYGFAKVLVIQDLELPVGVYSAIVLSVIDGDSNNSYVLQNDGSRKILDVTSSELVLPGFTLTSGSSTFIVEFSLAQALLFNSVSDSYQLTASGARVQQESTAAAVKGQVDAALFDLQAPCDAKADPLLGNSVYLYSGINLVQTNLADIFTPASSNAIPADAIAPYAVVRVVADNVNGGWVYSFAYLPAGDYTLAFTCAAEDDAPVDYNGLAIPFPTDQVYEVKLLEGATLSCDLAVGASCIQSVSP